MNDIHRPATVALDYLAERLVPGERLFRRLAASTRQYRVVEVAEDPARPGMGWLEVDVQETTAQVTYRVAISVRLVDGEKARFVDGPRQQLEAFLGSGLYRQAARALPSGTGGEQRVDGSDYF